MSLFRTVTRLAVRNSDKIKRAAEDNADKITGTVGKVAEKIDERTGGKHRDKLDKVEGAVDKALNKDTGPGPAPDPGTTPPA